jgi:starch phosphorylase
MTSSNYYLIPLVRFGLLVFQEKDGTYTFQLPVCLGGLDPEAVRVLLYTEPRLGGEPEIHAMTRGEEGSDPPGSYSYRVGIPARRPAMDYTPRVIPAFDGARVPIEANQILWYR